ncbi:hypothetical protein HDF18_14880 [Mucilaginibacter sp. X5P1]|uniref:hypothetical protein n=1 Tax=Mucilaginibacter sp. X5P1 TaxID=2723088 RepID=UPI00160B7D91|nr:hypothetical protein [Mucilaginibacter sp. X5P1]MBB6138893.1 hypothetical protein [Mucilaginibacter sp. X5P1]
MKKTNLLVSGLLLISISACTKNNSVTPATHSKTNTTGINDRLKDTIDAKSPLLKRDTIDLHNLRFKDTIDIKLKSPLLRKDTID